MAINKKYKLAVMVSGSGTILAAMIRQKLPIDLVIADRNCRGIDIAAKNKINTLIISRNSFNWNFKKPKLFKRREFSLEIAKNLNAQKINLVAMAGFMTVLDSSFFNLYQGIILNTHPALLPSFPGAHAAADALKFGVKITGCTVHIATAKVDYGQILAQEAVKVLPTDTENTLQDRIKIKERILYPKVLKSFFIPH